MLTGDQGNGHDLDAGSEPPDVEQIASAALDAAKEGLRRAAHDLGLQYTFYLLTQLVLSARRDEWQEGLAPFGIRLSPDATLLDLSAELQGAIDDYVSSHGHPSDVTEIAQQAACAAVVAMAAPRAVTLFGSGRDELQAAVRRISTKSGFAELSQQFFARFIAHYLNFYLSRATASQMGNGRIQQVGDITAFNDDLYVHCYQSAKIVRDFSGDWYSKTEFREGINLGNTSNFMTVALRKLRAELHRQGPKP